MRVGYFYYENVPEIIDLIQLNDTHGVTMTFGLLLLTISAELFFPVLNLHTGFSVITSPSAGEREEKGSERNCFNWVFGPSACGLNHGAPSL